MLAKACSLRCFIAEDVRTVRRFLSSYGLKGHIAEIEFHELNEHSSAEEIEAMLALMDTGDVGLMSEAGLPAVADPGADLVALCHSHGIEVVPLVGPSSLMLALMGSGLNGQSFAFKGYLPAKTDERRNAIRAMEKISAQMKQSQILIETPYRNDALFQDLLRDLSPKTRICVAVDITLPTQLIRTMSAAQWKRQEGFTIGKRPCVFIVLA